MHNQDTMWNETVRDVFVVGLRNAHAVENEALTLIDRQLWRIENHPDMAQRHAMAGDEIIKNSFANSQRLRRTRPVSAAS